MKLIKLRIMEHQKKVEAAGALIGNNIVNKKRKVSRSSPHNY